MKHSFPPCKRSAPWSASAFTLVEMMVAVGLVSFILLVLIQMIDATGKAWNSGTRRVDAFREARAALHIMERDLAGLQTDWYERDSLKNPSAFAHKAALPMLIGNASEMPDISVKGDPVKPGTDHLFFLTTTGDLTTSPATRLPEDGDLGVVGYYVTFEPEDPEDTNSRPVYKLYRYYKHSKQTFTRLYEYLRAGGTDLEGFLNDAPSGTPLAERDQHEPLAFNVTDFTVKPYFYSMKPGELGAVKPFVPEDAADPVKVEAKLTPRQPDFLEVTLAVLGNQSVARLPRGESDAWQRTPIGTNLPTDVAGQTVSTEARVFTTRINCN